MSKRRQKIKKLKDEIKNAIKMVDGVKDEHNEKVRENDI